MYGKLRKYISECIKELEEDYEFSYDTVHKPPLAAAQNAREALQIIANNNLIDKSDYSENLGNGKERARKISAMSPLNHPELKRLHAMFTALEKAYKMEVNSGKTIKNSGIIQIWKLNGGDEGKEWAESEIEKAKDYNLHHKKNRKGPERSALYKNLMNQLNVRPNRTPWRNTGKPPTLKTFKGI